MKRTKRYRLREATERSFPPWLANQVRDGKIITTRFINIDSFDTLTYLCEGRRSRVSISKLRTSGHYYALRGVKKKWIFKERALDQVRREARIHLGLQSKFIVNLFRVFDHHSFVFFVQEYCVGGTLQLLRRRAHPRLAPPKVFGPDFVRFYAAQITSALAYLHERNIAHRNLLPENVGIAWNGHVKLLGFGHAVEISEDPYVLLTTERDAAISLSSAAPEFLSPEQRAKLLSAQDVETVHAFEVDWWALGVLIFQLTFGYDPYGNENVEDEEAVCKRILSNRRAHRILWTDAVTRKVRGEGVMDCIDGLLTFTRGDRWGFEELKQSRFFSMIGDWTLLHHMDAPYYPRDYLVSGDTSCFKAPQRAHKRMHSKPGVSPEELQVRPTEAEIEYTYFTHICKELMAETVKTCTIRARWEWSEGQLDADAILHDEGMEYSDMFRRLEHGLNKKAERQARRQALFDDLKNRPRLPSLLNANEEEKPAIGQRARRSAARRATKHLIQQ